MQESAEKCNNLIQCSRCKKKFYEDGFSANRLGIRYKTCIECAKRRELYTDCKHKVLRKQCEKCIMEHREKGRLRYANSKCDHNKDKNECSICDIDAFNLFRAKQFSKNALGWIPYYWAESNVYGISAKRESGIHSVEDYNNQAQKWDNKFRDLVTRQKMDQKFYEQVMSNLRPCRCYISPPAEIPENIPGVIDKLTDYLKSWCIKA